AGPDVLLRAVDGTGARIVEALARPGAHERGRRPGRPELVGTAVAGPQLDQYPVGRTLAGHVEALAGQLYRPVADRPGLRRAARCAGVDDDRGAVGGAVRGQALAGEPGGDRAGTGRYAGDREVVELVGVVPDAP